MRSGVGVAFIILLISLPAIQLRAIDEEAAMKAAANKYPELARPGSAFERRFSALVEEWKEKAKHGYLSKFKDPCWPIHFAIRVAAELRQQKSGVSQESERMAFDPIRFGESELELHKQMQRPIVAMNLTQIWESFVTTRSKFPPKLATTYSQYSYVFVAHPGAVGLSRIEFNAFGEDPFGHKRGPAHDLPKVRRTWEAFRDIAQSKFDKPIFNRSFPEIGEFSGVDADIDTDIWDYDGLEIELSVRGYRFPDSPRTFDTVLMATDVLRKVANDEAVVPPSMQRGSPSPLASIVLPSSQPTLAPQFVLLKEPVKIKIPYGETVLPAGSRLKVISRNGDYVTIRYMDGLYPVPVRATELE